MQKVNNLLLKNYCKTPNNQTNCDVHYLDYNQKKLHISIETFTMTSTREKEKNTTMVET